MKDYSLKINGHNYSVQIDDVNGFDDTMITPFRERIEANGLTADDLDLVRVPFANVSRYTYC